MNSKSPGPARLKERGLLRKDLTTRKPPTTGCKDKVAGFDLSVPPGDPREDSIRRAQEAEDGTQEDNGVMPRS